MAAAIPPWRLSLGIGSATAIACSSFSALSNNPQSMFWVLTGFQPILEGMPMSSHTSVLCRTAYLLATLSIPLVTNADENHGNDDSWRHQPYEIHNLVSDGAVTADFTDSNLVNGWGVAFNPNGFVWLVDNG